MSQSDTRPSAQDGSLPETLSRTEELLEALEAEQNKVQIPAHIRRLAEKAREELEELTVCGYCEGTGKTRSDIYGTILVGTCPRCHGQGFVPS